MLTDPHIIECNAGLFKPVTSPPAFDPGRTFGCWRVIPDDRNGNNVWVFPDVDEPRHQAVLFSDAQKKVNSRRKART